MKHLTIQTIGLVLTTLSAVSPADTVTQTDLRTPTTDAIAPTDGSTVTQVPPAAPATEETLLPADSTLPISKTPYAATLLKTWSAACVGASLAANPARPEPEYLADCNCVPDVFKDTVTATDWTTLTTKAALTAAQKTKGHAALVRAKEQCLTDPSFPWAVLFPGGIL